LQITLPHPPPPYLASVPKRDLATTASHLTHRAQATRDVFGLPILALHDPADCPSLLRETSRVRWAEQLDRGGTEHQSADSSAGYNATRICTKARTYVPCTRCADTSRDTIYTHICLPPHFTTPTPWADAAAPHFPAPLCGFPTPPPPPPYRFPAFAAWRTHLPLRARAFGRAHFTLRTTFFFLATRWASGPHAHAPHCRL